MISVDTAADVARRHGLTLTDAQALAVLASDEDHAEALASKFAPDTDGAETAERIIRDGRAVR